MAYLCAASWLKRHLSVPPSLSFKRTLPPFKGFPGGSEIKASACNAGDLGSIPGWGRSPGEGNGNPLQYPCLENPMDGGAWWATVHRVPKSPTQLSDLTFTTFQRWDLHSLRLEGFPLQGTGTKVGSGLGCPVPRPRMWGYQGSQSATSIIQEIGVGGGQWMWIGNTVALACNWNSTGIPLFHDKRRRVWRQKSDTFGGGGRDPEIWLVHITTSECQSLSSVVLFATPRTVAHQAPLSMGFSRQKYWKGLPCPPPGDLPNPGLEPGCPTLQTNSLPSELPGIVLLLPLIRLNTLIRKPRCHSTTSWSRPP